VKDRPTASKTTDLPKQQHVAAGTLGVDKLAQLFAAISAQLQKDCVFFSNK